VRCNMIPLMLHCTRFHGALHKSSALQRTM
jgi:hypothetical protein